MGLATWRAAALCLPLALAAPANGPARAEAVSARTAYAHFPLRATSEAGLLGEIRRRGPLVAHRRSFARTRMRAAISTRMAGPPGHCRMRAVSIDLRFTVLLPRALNARRLGPSARRRWGAFVRRLKRHELRHRAIWRACANKARRAMLKLSAPSCAALKKRAEKVYRAVMDACGKRHDAFDAREKAAVLRDPFVRAALGLDRQKPRRGR